MKILPHPQAPIYQNVSSEEAELIKNQLVSEIESGNISTSDEELRKHLRQLCLVNLYFFLTFVCAHSAPYDKLDDKLHKEVCEFYQRNAYEGSRAFLILPRGHCKSRIGTEGGTAWDILRDPNITIKIVNAISDIAHDFLHEVQGLFTENILLKWLFPEYIPVKNASRWNADEMVVPNRTKSQREATVECGGVGGAGEGKHFRILKIDDMFGLKTLNSMRQSGAEMERAKTWFNTQTASLLDGPSRSRVWLSGTRYAVDDGYHDILLNCRSWTGSECPPYKPVSDGKYAIYFQPAMVDGKPIFPEFFTEDFYRDLAVKDPWSWQTQYCNNPMEAGLTELNQYQTFEFKMVWQEDAGWILRTFEGEERTFPLSDCDVVIACDPAATEKGWSAKTSQSAVGVVAHAPDNRKYILALKVGYVSASQIFEWMFYLAEKFYGYYRKTVLESQGAFKILGPILRDWEKEYNLRRQQERKPIIHLNLREVSKVGEKDAVIRSTLEPELREGNVWIEKSIKEDVDNQLIAFPQSQKKDILDMLSLAFKSTYRPLNEVEEVRLRRREERFEKRVCGYGGY